MHLRQLDRDAPGGVYLCQIDERISCGACCGLYNVKDQSRAGLTGMLAARTDRFAGISRDVDAILAFKREIEAREDGERPFADFHHCPYIGLVGRRRSRVGCLLHPFAEGNRGVDFRGVSFYGGMACRVYFCPSCRELPREYKKIIRETAENWHRYGLIITETNLVEALFGELEKRLDRRIVKKEIVGSRRRTGVIRELLDLKIEWPHRLAPGRELCNYFFEEGLYTKPRIDYREIGARRSRYDAILRELVSTFKSKEELHLAEETLDRLFSRSAQSFR